jgi:hypothetical protein
VCSPEYERYAVAMRRRRRIALASREQEHRLAGDRSAFPRCRGERQRRLERLDTAPQRVRQDAANLRERAVHRAALGVEALPLCGDEAEDDDDRLVLREHQRRQPVARPHPIAAADAALALDRDPELLERRDVAADGPAVDVELVGDLASVDQRPGLQELEEREQPCRRGEHGEK